jgi:predicted GIY-YIG superfamily endonuclease
MLDICVCVCVCFNLYISTHTHTHTHNYIDTYKHTYTHARTQTHTHTHTHIHTHTHTHTHTHHTHTHTHTGDQGNIYCCYVLANADNSVSYCGITTDLERRLREHNGEIAGGARATRARRPWKLAAAVFGLADRSAAQSLEAQLKKNRKVRGVEARKAELRRLARICNQQLSQPPP